MTDRVLKPFVELVARSRVRPTDPTALAIVTDINASGALVRFEGDAAATSKRYRMVVGCNVGSRVLMVRIGRSWVVAGAVRAGPQIQVGNDVVTTNGSGIGSITFPEPYPATPTSVVCTGGSREIISFEVGTVGPSATGFTFYANDAGTGALITSANVRVLWIAHP